MEEPSQFSVGQTAQSLTCSVLEKPHRGLDACLIILLSCFRDRTSDLSPPTLSSLSSSSIIITFLRILSLVVSLALGVALFPMVLSWTEIVIF